MMRQTTRESTGASSAAEGVVLVDLDLKPIALDSGAEAILADLNGPGGIEPALPADVLNQLSAGCQGGQVAGNPIHLASARHEYSCRAFLVKSRDSNVGPMLALHLKKEISVVDAVHQVGIDYHLTDREQEVLIGVAMGLTSKELAGRMDISPNTVKAFLRLIMIKMGVATRAGIVGKLLGQNGRAGS
ncbi:MAG TPA: helix-turn-helix transcriptional regulator [Candidatus Acidoferrales bacterium]|nr:helix-turn-helix transcriptional regulator [Candidatus Acidoferrales bacterium]